MNASDLLTGKSLNDDARQAVRGTLDSLRQWNDEVSAANDRCLAKALSEVAAVQRALGWPEHISTAARDGTFDEVVSHANNDVGHNITQLDFLDFSG